MTRASRPRTALVGTGRVARALSPLLVACGYPVVAIAGRRATSARAIARSIRGASATASPERAAREAELILLAVPDREIAPLARRLAGAGVPGWRGKTVLHHAGALGAGILDPLREAGAEVGVLHPLQALGDPALARHVLPGSRARVEGSRKGAAVARRLARDLGLVPLDLGPDAGDDERVAYHAAASVASNDLVALLGVAVDLLQAAGLDRHTALCALGPLGRGTLLQAERAGLAAAITGPVARGDAETVRRHLRRLERSSPGDARLHRLLSLRLLDLARREGLAVAPADRRRLLRVLGGRGGPRRAPAV